MRHKNDFKGGVSENELARMANNEAQRGMDEYTDYGVGAALVVNYDGDRFAVYTGRNIHLSGMQVKVHAEQLACFQLLLDLNHYEFQDYEISLRNMFVVTSEHDFALRCGHCVQVVTAVCEYLEQDRSEMLYTAAGKVDGQWETEAYPLSFLLPESYTAKRRQMMYEEREE